MTAITSVAPPRVFVPVGGGYVSKSTTTTAEDNSPSYQRYTYQCTKISDRLSVSDYESMVAIARKVIYGSDS
ncbi:hypothetical protein AP9108_19265 [Arthrospira sp. PCC 9108]|nr:hypothetical protein AP9108_19265 [Arthrospira sp. PCC 9108]